MPILGEVDPDAGLFTVSYEARLRLDAGFSFSCMNMNLSSDRRREHNILFLQMAPR